MNFKIGELHPNTPYLFADLAELVLLTGYNGREKLHKNDLEGVLHRGAISPEEMDQEFEAETAADNMNQTGAEKNSRRETQLEDVLMQLGYRSHALIEYYPFDLIGEELILQDKTVKRRVYGLLLACSRLRSFEGKGIAQKWARAFTQICKVAMAGLLPTHASTRIFDANSEDRHNYYSTNLKDALKILGRDLRVFRIHEDECNRAGTSGDAGLDLVATVDFDDGAATSYAILGQCGAQETGWPKKTLEAHSIRWRSYFQLLFDYPGIMFTPVCYRTANGEWSDNQSATGILLLDRGRILKLIDVQNRWEEITTSQWFIDFETELATVKTSD